MVTKIAGVWFKKINKKKDLLQLKHEKNDREFTYIKMVKLNI